MRSQNGINSRNPYESNDESNAKATMIATAKATQGMLVTICNYSFYQDFQNYGSNGESNNEKATKPTREQRQPDNINKNDKNEKNEKNEEVLPPISPLEAAISDFKAFRKGIKKPMTDRAVELLYINLQKLAGDDDALKIAIINQSIFNGWQGVFALKEDVKPAAPASPEPRKPRSGHLETIINAYGKPEEVWKADKEDG